MENLWKKYGGSVQFIAVNLVQTLQDLQNWIAGMSGGVTFPVLHDPNWAIARLYWTGSTIYFPLIYIIGADTKIKSIYSSGTLFTESELEGHVTDVVYMRNPVDVEMVVDVSDSMNLLPAGASSGDTKLMLLKQAANIVLDLFMAHGQQGDTMGLVRFTDNASEFEFGGKKLLPISQNETRLRGEFAALVTGTCTAMGAGLQTAFDTFVAEGTQQRFAVLCTDGMQNIEPKVTDVSGHLEIIDSGGWLCGGHSSTPPHPGTDIKTYATRVHTIGIGLTATYEPMLQSIANQTGGFYRGTHDPQTDLDLIYAVDLCNCLASGSPSVVRHATGTLVAEKCQAVETFSVNRSARKLSVVLSWQKSQCCFLTFWLRAPDGTLLTLDREMKTFEDRCVASIYLPKEQDEKKLNYVGRWTMIIRGETAAGSADYHMLALVEDREIKCGLHYPRKTYSVGDVLPLTIYLPEVTKSPFRLLDLVIESALPRVSPGELLQNYRMSAWELERSAAARAISKIDPRALLQSKLRRIEADPRMRGLLQPERKRRSVRAGTLECSLKEREIRVPLHLTQAGLASYKLEIFCESNDTGPVDRTDLVSVLVGAGPVDPKSSSAAAVTTEGKGGPGLSLMITPRSERGELLGPGLAQEIRVVIGKEPIKATVIDLIDGTYCVEISHPEDIKKAPAAVLFGGKTLWSGLV